MKSRWFSRGLMLSVALVSSIGVAACGQAQSTQNEAPDKVAAAAETRAAAHRPGQRIFRQIEALDLSADQRDDLSDIQRTLEADLTTHRKSVRHAAEILANGLEAGALDAREMEASQKVLAAAASDATTSIERAMNEVHAVLDADQRADLVLSLRAQREQMREGAAAEGGERHRGGLATLAEKLGLSNQQVATLKGEAQAQIDKVFPDRKARREAWEAKMNAVGDAFMTEDFHAEDFALGADADGAIASFTSAAKQAIDLSNGVLDAGQRRIAASLLRSHAAKL